MTAQLQVMYEWTMHHRFYQPVYISVGMLSRIERFNDACIWYIITLVMIHFLICQHFDNIILHDFMLATVMGKKTSWHTWCRLLLLSPYHWYKKLEMTLFNRKQRFPFLISFPTPHQSILGALVRLLTKWLGSKGLARILKLPIIFERVPIQNGVKWSKMG